MKSNPKNKSFLVMAFPLGILLYGCTESNSDLTKSSFEGLITYYQAESPEKLEREMNYKCSQPTETGLVSCLHNDTKFIDGACTEACGEMRYTFNKGKLALVGYFADKDEAIAFFDKASEHLGKPEGIYNRVYSDGTTTENFKAININEKFKRFIGQAEKDMEALSVNWNWDTPKGKLNYNEKTGYRNGALTGKNEYFIGLYIDKNENNKTTNSEEYKISFSPNRINLKGLYPGMQAEGAEEALTSICRTCPRLTKGDVTYLYLHGHPSRPMMGWHRIAVAINRDTDISYSVWSTVFSDEVTAREHIKQIQSLKDWSGIEFETKKGRNNGVYFESWGAGELKKSQSGELTGRRVYMRINPDSRGFFSSAYLKDGNYFPPGQ